MIKILHKKDEMTPGIGSTCSLLISVDDYLYIMDNHKLALWCWCNKNTVGNNLLHIDYHWDIDEYDTNLNKGIENIHNATIEKYITNTKNEFNDNRPNNQLKIDWGNYITIPSHNFFNNVYFFIKEENDDKESFFNNWFINKSLHKNIESKKLFSEVDSILSKNKCIVNIDLDYFFEIHSEHPYKINYEELYKLGKILHKNKNNISLITIALTPYYCKYDYNDVSKIYSNECLKVLDHLLVGLNISEIDTILKHIDDLNLNINL